MTSETMPRFGDPKAAHAYIVECEKPDSTGRGIRYRCDVFVYAANRDHAARIVEREGFAVRSVNMHG